MNKTHLTLLAALFLTGCPSDTSGALDTDGGTDSASQGSTTDGSETNPTTQTTTGDATSESTTSSSGSEASTNGEGTDSGCTDAAECDNGDACDGAEDCVDGQCVAGEPLQCADEVACTVDTCDPELGCVFTPNNDRCPCGETCDPTMGCGDYCVPATCNGMLFECGNCIDDDGDCAIDSADLDCWGPCDNNEEGYDGEIPGQQNQSTCLVLDCYYDFDSGTGNDNCYWSHSCDMLEPQGCTYDPATNIPGTGDSCAELFDTQSQACLDYCLPLTPNGCDCFGCCDVTLEDDTTVTVYLGSSDGQDNGTCTLDVIDDPALCQPCTQVPGCLNECEDCEICLGQDMLPPGCDEQTCPEGVQPCGLPGQDPCAEGFACITGCCYPNPR